MMTDHGADDRRATVGEGGAGRSKWAGSMLIGAGSGAMLALLTGAVSDARIFAYMTSDPGEYLTIPAVLGAVVGVGVVLLRR